MTLQISYKVKFLGGMDQIFNCKEMSLSTYKLTIKELIVLLSKKVEKVEMFAMNEEVYFIY